MVDKLHQIKPAFTIEPMTHGNGFKVVMAPNPFAPVMHINDFATEEAAQAWIENDSAAWFTKLTSGM